MGICRPGCVHVGGYWDEGGGMVCVSLCDGERGGGE